MNSDMSLWNTAEVTNMYGMFQYARTFNSPIRKWDVSKVTDMGYMFYAALAFQQDVSGWNVAGVPLNTITSNGVTYYFYFINIFYDATQMSAYWKCDNTLGLKTESIKHCPPNLLVPR